MPITTLRSFNFQGIEKPDWLYIKKTNRPMSPEQEAVLVEAPGKAGAYYFGKKTKARPLSFEFFIMADNDQDLWEKAEWVTNWLDTEEPQPLIINDEGTKEYTALFVSTGDDLEQLAAMGDSVLSFLCPDPYKKGEEVTETLGAVTQIINLGTAPAFPFIVANFTQDSTHLALVTDEQFFLIGEPESVERESLPRLELVAHYDLQNMTGWTQNGTRTDGTVSGTMASNGNDFIATDYGTGPGWHGPAVKTSLPAPLNNWRIEAYGSLFATDPDELGKIELYLMDANGGILAKLGLRDATARMENTIGEVRIGEAGAGEYHMINTHGIRPGLWNNFYGQLILEKEGNRFYANIRKFDTKERIFHTAWPVTIHDTAARWENDLAHVQLHIAAFSTNAIVENLRWQNVKVYRINPVGAEQTNVIFKAGDELIIDTEKKAAYLNGAPFMGPIAYESQFIKLQPGPQEIRMTPEGAANVTLSYRKRFK